MKAQKKVQILSVAGRLIKPDEADPVIVDTNKISKGERAWDGHLILIRDLKNGKSQIIRLA